MAQEIRLVHGSDPLNELHGCDPSEIRGSTETIVLRLAPAANPYTLVRSGLTTPHYQRGKSPKRVVLVNSIEPIVPVFVTLHGNQGQDQQQASTKGTAYAIWAIFGEA